jgi:hypothetical protein
MRVPVTAILVAVVVPLTATAAVACANARAASPNGEAAKTPDQIFADSKKAALGARSVRFIEQNYEDVYLLAGKGGRGQIVEDGSEWNVVRIGGNAYLKVPRAFLAKFIGSSLRASAEKLLKGRWIEVSAASGAAFAFLIPQTDLAATVEYVLDAQHGVLKMGALTTVDGQSAIPLIDTTKGATLYVSATGPPYPLKATGEFKVTGQKWSLSFDDWNAPVTLAPPANAIRLS